MTDPKGTRFKSSFAVLALLFATVAPCGGAAAEEIALELNKMVQRDDACRLTFLIRNDGADRFQTFKTELVLFGDDGIIDRRFTGDMAPLRPAKASVVSFDMAGLKCQNVSQVLLNDVVACEGSGGQRDDCVEKIGVTSRAGVPLTK